MSDLQDTTTHDNLKRAFLREAGNAHRYLYFARIAEIEGFPEPARLLRDLAESCLCNAHGNLDFLKIGGDPYSDLPIGETANNLLAAIASVTEDQTGLYPECAGAAKVDGYPDIANWFETMTRTSRSHTEKLHRALTEVQEVPCEETK